MVKENKAHSQWKYLILPKRENITKYKKNI